MTTHRAGQVKRVKVEASEDLVQWKRGLHHSITHLSSAFKNNSHEEPQFLPINRGLNSGHKVGTNFDEGKHKAFQPIKLS